MIGSKKSHGLEYQWFSPAKNRVKHTFTRTVVPKVTSNLHSLPARRLTCVGGAGACWVSTEASASSRPGRDIALHGTSSFLIELYTKRTSTRISNIVILRDLGSEIVHFGSLRQNEDHQIGGLVSTTMRRTSGCFDCLHVSSQPWQRLMWGGTWTTYSRHGRTHLYETQRVV